MSRQAEDFAVVARAALGRGDYLQALSLLREAVGLEPASAELRNDLGVLLNYLGRDEAAASCYREAINLGPGRGQFYYHLSTVTQFKPTDPLLPVMRDQYCSRDANLAKRVYLGFALGKACDDVGDHEQAFTFYAEANRNYRSTITYNPEQESRRFQAIENSCGEEGSELTVAASRERAPVFIVGMPRSGTSLIEQILAGHSRVKAIGETDYFGNCLRSKKQNSDREFPALLDDCPAEQQVAWGQQFLNQYGADAEAGQLLVEKTTLNFQYIGWLHQLFPSARFVYCRRDPMDTCWSIFSRLFVQGGHRYAYDQVELGQYFSAQERLMRHWKGMYSELIHEVHYSELVDKPEATILQLLNFCDLPMEQACLDFHTTERGVATASAVQVRQPIYRVKEAPSKPYLDYLRPLQDSLVEAPGRAASNDG